MTCSQVWRAGGQRCAGAYRTPPGDGSPGRLRNHDVSVTIPWSRTRLDRLGGSD